MRIIGIFLLLALATAGCATSTTPARPGFAPLRGADCLDPSSARSWEDVSTDELRVDAGRHHYRITLAGCGRIGVGPELRFAGDPITGRVCGVPGDAVLVDGRRCPIERLELLEGDDRFEADGDESGAASEADGDEGGAATEADGDEG